MKGAHYDGYFQELIVQYYYYDYHHIMLESE